MSTASPSSSSAATTASGHDVWSPGVRVVAKGDIGGAIIEAPAYPHGEIDAVIEAWVDDIERGRWLHAV